MLSGAVRGLPDVTELVYPAEVAPIGIRTLQQSVVIGRAALRSIDALGGPWVGVGFSLGAYTLTEYAMLDRPKNLKGLVLLGNPLRPRGHVAHPGVPTSRCGIAGEVPIVGVPVYDFAIPDDPITSCPIDNGLRSIADLVSGRRQPTPARWWDAFGTIDWARKYLGPNSRHVAYGIEKVPASDRSYVQAARDAVVGLL